MCTCVHNYVRHSDICIGEYGKFIHTVSVYREILELGIKQIFNLMYKYYESPIVLSPPVLHVHELFNRLFDHFCWKAAPL